MTINTLIDALRELLILLPAIFFTITIHEFFQGLAAVKMGDNTPADTGMIKFNPLYFIDKLGLLCFVLFRYGWSSSITIDSRNFKNPKIDTITVIMTGMLVNLISALLFLILIILYKPHPDGYIYNLFMTVTQINLNFFFLNFLPFLPLAGGKIISVFYPGYHRFEIIGTIILLLFLIFNLTKFFDIIVFNLINIFI